MSTQVKTLIKMLDYQLIFIEEKQLQFKFPKTKNISGENY
jgi:hypothetical protein